MVPVLRDPVLSELGALASVIAILSLAAIAVRRARSCAEQDRAFGLTVTAFLVVGPLSWAHTLLLLMLPIAVLAHDWSDYSKTRKTLFLTSAVGVWLAPYTVYSVLALHDTLPAHPWITFTAYSYQLYALLILFALGLRVGDRASNQFA
jgi:hypothetical protein